MNYRIIGKNTYVFSWIKDSKKYSRYVKARSLNSAKRKLKNNLKKNLQKNIKEEKHGWYFSR